jgi:hypothetical protein
MEETGKVLHLEYSFIYAAAWTLHIMEETGKVLHLEYSFMYAAAWTLHRKIINSWEVLKCGAGEGWRLRLIMCEKKKCYIESSRGMFCKQ